MAVINTIDPDLLTLNRTKVDLSEDGVNDLKATGSTELNLKNIIKGSARQRSPKETVDINGFFRLVKKVVDFKVEKDGWNKTLVFTEDFPDDEDDISGEIITFGIQKRVPALMEQSVNALKRNPLRARKPIFRDHEFDWANPKYKVEVSGWLFDNFVQFTCWSRENKLANIRALWFEELMLEYEWVFQANGIHFLRYEGRGEDIEEIYKNRKVAGRPMVYLVRTEKIISKHEKTFEELTLRLNRLYK